MHANWKLHVYYVVTTLLVIIAFIHFNFIDNERIFVTKTCDDYYFSHTYYKCDDGKKCFYNGLESDDCPNDILVHVLFLLVTLSVAIFSKYADVFFFHYMIQLGFWWCAFKYDYMTEKSEQVIINKSSFLLTVVPILHIIYEKRLAQVLDGNRDTFFFFFMPFWLFGINIDTFISMLDLKLSLSSEFNSDTTTVFLFVISVVFISSYQFYKIVQNEKVLTSMAYVFTVSLFTIPFFYTGMHIHIHHYLFALFTFPLIQCSRDDCFSFAIWGAMIGLFVNGVVVWGNDPLFY